MMTMINDNDDDNDYDDGSGDEMAIDIQLCIWKGGLSSSLLLFGEI